MQMVQDLHRCEVGVGASGQRFPTLARRIFRLKTPQRTGHITGHVYVFAAFQLPEKCLLRTSCDFRFKGAEQTREASGPVALWVRRCNLEVAPLCRRKLWWLESTRSVVSCRAMCMNLMSHTNVDQAPETSKLVCCGSPRLSELGLPLEKDPGAAQGAGNRKWAKEGPGSPGGPVIYEGHLFFRKDTYVLRNAKLKATKTLNLDVQSCLTPRVPQTVYQSQMFNFGRCFRALGLVGMV